MSFSVFCECALLNIDQVYEGALDESLAPGTHPIWSRGREPTGDPSTRTITRITVPLTHLFSGSFPAKPSRSPIISSTPTPITVSASDCMRCKKQAYHSLSELAVTADRKTQGVLVGRSRDAGWPDSWVSVVRSLPHFSLLPVTHDNLILTLFPLPLSGNPSFSPSNTTAVQPSPDGPVSQCIFGYTRTFVVAPSEMANLHDVTSSSCTCCIICDSQLIPCSGEEQH